jgi:hypothetical protein
MHMVMYNMQTLRQITAGVCMAGSSRERDTCLKDLEQRASSIPSLAAKPAGPCTSYHSETYTLQYTEANTISDAGICAEHGVY